MRGKVFISPLLWWTPEASYLTIIMLDFLVSSALRISSLLSLYVYVFLEVCWLKLFDPSLSLFGMGDVYVKDILNSSQSMPSQLTYNYYYYLSSKRKILYLLLDCFGEYGNIWEQSYFWLGLFQRQVRCSWTVRYLSSSIRTYLFSSSLLSSLTFSVDDVSYECRGNLAFHLCIGS